MIFYGFMQIVGSSEFPTILFRKRRNDRERISIIV